MTRAKVLTISRRELFQSREKRRIGKFNLGASHMSNHKHQLAIAQRMHLKVGLECRRNRCKLRRDFRKFGRVLIAQRKSTAQT
ncbi:hypothetical protein [uncultured Maritalea sp.]|uniref:hypothetical protein n=1 Tax=uncultured Maritalea sp. TaxID=757249 RepID=UPI00345CA1C1